MNKWTNAAKLRLVAIQAEETRSDDLGVIVAALAQLPPGRLKKVLNEDVLAVLEKYGVAIE
ncbi:MAG: hypothetical protein ACI3WQ_09280 [Faecousia sp.]